MIVQTPRLLLRAATEADDGFILTLLNTPGFLRNIGDRGLRTLADARGYIRDRILASYAEHGFGMWVVELAGETKPVGLAGLVRRAGLETPDVGYAFLPEAWGRGVAQEAAAAVVTYAREHLGLGPLCAITSVDNHASMAVLRKVGFTYEGLTRLPGADDDSTLFRI